MSGWVRAWRHLLAFARKPPKRNATTGVSNRARANQATPFLTMMVLCHHAYCYRNAQPYNRRNNDEWN